MFLWIRQLTDRSSRRTDFKSVPFAFKKYCRLSPLGVANHNVPDVDCRSTNEKLEEKGEKNEIYQLQCYTLYLAWSKRSVQAVGQRMFQMNSTNGPLFNIVSVYNRQRGSILLSIVEYT